MIWVTTDTHFGHDKIKEYCGRPDDFESLILNNIKKYVKDDDILIHFGDFSIGNHEYWHQQFMKFGTFKRWLIKGNHDKATNTWYMNHGWDFVGDSISLRMFGLHMLLTHRPEICDNHDINVHGHFHNSNENRHEKELKKIKTSKHKLIMLEHHYKPLSLRKVVGK